MDGTQQGSKARSRLWVSIWLAYAGAAAVVIATDSRAVPVPGSERQELPAMQFIAAVLDQPSVAIGKLKGCLASKPRSGDEVPVAFGFHAASTSANLDTRMLECFQMP